jgi:fucose 4-O-acetylase-like acetyltransferase
MSRKLLSLSGLSILAVVLNHSAGKGFIALFWWAHRYRPVQSPNFDLIGSPTYYGLTLLQHITLFSVPAFLFISGYFVAYAAKGKCLGVSWGFVRQRITNLVWPYLIWSMVIFIGNALLNNEILSVFEYIKRVVFGEASDAYWFIPVLIQFYLLSPWIVKIAKKSPKLVLGLAATFQLIVVSLFYLRVFGINFALFVTQNYWLFIVSALYFPLGIVFGLKQELYIRQLFRFRWLLIVAAILCVLLSIIECEWIYQLSTSYNLSRSPLKITSVLFTTAFIISFVSSKSLNSKMWSNIIYFGSFTYGIYLIHKEFQTLLSRIIYHFMPHLLANQLLFSLFLFLLGVGIPILLMEIARRSPARRVYSYLFG